jgi:iron complex transport system substrate-binding protein
VTRAAALGALLLAAAGAALPAQPVAVRDDANAVVSLPAPARRVISLSPALTELVFDAGGGDRLAGVDSASDTPDAALALPRVGDAAGLDFERAIALRPDLILLWRSGNKASDRARLTTLSVPVFESEPRRLEDIARTLRTLGTLLDTRSTAERQAAAFEQRLSGLRGRYAAAPPVSAFVEIWHQPLMTLNGAHLVTDALSVCRVNNPFAALRTLAGSVSLEDVLAADPAAIVSATGFPDDVQAWQRVRSLRAVREGRVLQIDPNALTRPTPRILDAVEQVCGWLHPG